MKKIIIFGIFLLAFFLRLYKINWDQGYHLHPDERFLAMVEDGIKLPNSLSQYLNTGTSPLNPYNYREFQFFVYGTFPVFLVKYISVLFNLDNYNQLYLVGRILSALFDSFNIIGIYLLLKLISPKNKKSFLLFLPSLLYAFCVLPIQASHFFAVDTFLTTMLLFVFIMLSYWVIKQKTFFLFLASLLFGLALATKISACLFSPIIFLFFLYHFFTTKKTNKISLFKGNTGLSGKGFSPLIIFPVLSLLIFRFFQPYAFIGIFKFNPIFVGNMVYLKSLLTSRDVFYPPEIQWLSKTPLIFPVYNLLVWGLGLPLSFGLLYSLINLIKKLKSKIKFSNQPRPFIILSLIIWILFLITHQGLQFTSTMRYFLPVYPFIMVLIGLIIPNQKIIYFIFLFHVLYSILFLSIYNRPHSRVQASTWIYNNIPKGSNITNEYWDDPLPLNFPDQNPMIYKNNMLSLYDSDTPQKWDQINSALEQADYLIMSSNRLWSSISQVPDKYPLTAKFYQNLFDGKTNFKKTIEINSYPGIKIPFMKKCLYLGPTNFPYQDQKNTWFAIDNQCQYPGIYLRDDLAEEAFSVYDHPKVLIFKK